MNPVAATCLALAFSLCLFSGALGAAPSPAETKTPAPQGPPAFGPPDPDTWEPLAAFTDEFDGTALDAAKWLATYPDWKGRPPGLFRPSNVAVQGGQLHITMRKETVADAPKGYHTYTCGAVRSKAAVLYGFFEARCKAMASRGSSAFWFNNAAPTWWTEIDVFEIGARAPGHERKVHMNVHVFRTPAEGAKHWDKSAVWESPANLADDYHVYGLQWEKDRIAWYVDGLARRTIENTHWHQPLYLDFDSETMPDWFGLPDADDLPSTFRIDYVRAWQRKGQGKADEAKASTAAPKQARP